MNLTNKSNSNQFIRILLVTTILIVSFYRAQGITCPAGTYLLTDSTTCLACAKTCATCTGPSSCTSCITGLVNSTSTTWWVSWWGSGCICPTSGTYYNPTTLTCSSCSIAVPKCATCTAGVNGVICSTCSAGTFKATSTSCVACSSGCAKCTSATACTACISSTYTLSGGICTAPCSSLVAQCMTCTTSPTVTCNTCKTGYYLSSNACVACGLDCATCNITGCITCLTGFTLVASVCTDCATAFSIPGCTKCSSTLCTGCLTSSGYALNTTTNLCDLTSTIGCLTNEALIAGICQPCSTAFDSQCTQCSPTACTACLIGYTLNSTTSTCNIICNANEVTIGGVCTLCSTLYTAECTQCNTVSCSACMTGYFYNSTAVLCEVNPTSTVCGDGAWIETAEPCDDGNSNNLDGCDANCQVEVDYVCLVADKLPSGASLCKFTKNITIIMTNIEKQTSSNIAHIFFTIEPPTFQEWNLQEIQKLLNPVTIVDQSTGTSTTIPFNSINYSFQRLNNQNQLQLIVDYGGQSIEGTYLKFNIDPTITSLPAINYLPPQPVNFAKLSSFYNAVNLYSYTSETYEFQNSVSGMGMCVGYLALIFAFLGLLSPVGKLIVLETLAVVQLSFFSILQFRKIPPTFIGLRNLIYSNGYNDQNFFQSPITQNDQTVFKLMGLDQSLFLNYNISFIVFFWIPFLVGLIGVILSCVNEKQSSSKREITDDLIEGKQANTNKNELLTEDFSKLFKSIIFKRILYEVSFYGILLTGYLVWISIFQGLKSDDLLNTLGPVLITLIWFGLGYKFIVEKVDSIDLNKNKNVKNEGLTETNSFVMIGFGEFKEMKMLIGRQDSFQQKKIDIWYGLLILERIIDSLVIAYFSSSIYCSAGIIAIYSVFLIALVMAHRKCQNSKQQTQRKTMFSNIFRNYVLRQAFNFITIILIQIIMMASQLTFKNSGATGDVFSTNEGTVKLVPVLILCLLLVNLFMNIFLWIWQIKNSQILQKAKQIKKLCINNSQRNSYSEKQKVESASDRKLKDEQEQVSAAMGKMMETIISQTPTNSPFIGIGEKEQRAKFDIPKLQNKFDLEHIQQENDAIELNEI